MKECYLLRARAATFQSVLACQNVDSAQRRSCSLVSVAIQQHDEGNQVRHVGQDAAVLVLTTPLQQLVRKEAHQGEQSGPRTGARQQLTLTDPQTHSLCRRCGRRSMHKQHKTCASCGYPAAKLRSCASEFGAGPRRARIRRGGVTADRLFASVHQTSGDRRPSGDTRPVPAACRTSRMSRVASRTGAPRRIFARARCPQLTLFHPAHQLPRGNRCHAQGQGHRLRVNHQNSIVGSLEGRSGERLLEKRGTISLAYGNIFVHRVILGGEITGESLGRGPAQAPVGRLGDDGKSAGAVWERTLGCGAGEQGTRSSCRYSCSFARGAPSSLAWLLSLRGRLFAFAQAVLPPSSPSSPFICSGLGRPRLFVAAP